MSEFSTLGRVGVTAAAKPTDGQLSPSNPVMDPETLELLQRQVVIQRQLIALNKSCGIAFYRPHFYQHVFHSSVNKRRGVFAGNRFGKSDCNAAETVAWMMGERVWYKTPFDILGVEHLAGKNRRTVVKHHHPGGDNHPLVRSGIPPYPTKQVIVCTNWEKVHEIWTSREADRPGKLWKFLPKGFAKATYQNNAGVIDEIHGTNGSLLKFMSVDSFKKNQLTAESSDWDRVGFDEPGPIGLWKGLARGLVDRDGQGDFTLTSLEEMWIYDYFNKDEQGPDAPDICNDRFAVRATIFDNPYQSDLAISRFEAELDEDEKQCRLHGLPLELSGLIYKEFRRDTHVLTRLPDGWKDWHLPDKRCILYARADTHPVTPHAVSFFALGPADIPVQCHEIWHSCGGDALADIILEYIKTTGCFFHGFKVEPAAWIKDPSNRTISIAKQLSAKGLFPRPASKDLTNGILAVRSALKNKSILFTPTCHRTLRQFGRYRWDTETGKPHDADDHFMENLYRLVIDKPKWFDPDTATSSFPIPDESFTTSDLSVNSLG